MKPIPVKKRLFEAEAIRARVSDLAADMAADHLGGDLVLVGVLRGSFMFLADLVRELYARGVGTRIDFLALESYGAGTVSSGTVRLHKDITIDVRGEEVILVDDILDTGRTLTLARDHVLGKGAAGCRSCVLLDKPARRVVPFQAEYVGFRVPDVFVAGYGLDLDGRGREWPFLAELETGA